MSRGNRRDDTQNVIGSSIGGEIKIIHLATEERVTDRTANQCKFESRRVECGSESANGLAFHKFAEATLCIGNAEHWSSLFAAVHHGPPPGRI